MPSSGDSENSSAENRRINGEAVMQCNDCDAEREVLGSIPAATSERQWSQELEPRSSMRSARLARNPLALGLILRRLPAPPQEAGSVGAVDSS